MVTEKQGEKGVGTSVLCKGILVGLRHSPIEPTPKGSPLPRSTTGLGLSLDIHVIGDIQDWHCSRPCLHRDDSLMTRNVFVLQLKGLLQALKSCINVI